MHKSSLLIPILNPLNPIPRIDTYFFKIHSNIVLPPTSRLSKALGLSVKVLKVLLPSSILAKWPVHLNLLDLITLTKLDTWYKHWISSLRSLLHFPLSSRLAPSIRHRILFSNRPTLSLNSSLRCFWKNMFLQICQTAKLVDYSCSAVHDC